MQVALHAPIAGMAGLALGLDFQKKLLQYATTVTALCHWHTAKVPLRWHAVGAAPKLLGDVVVLLVELVGGGSMFVAVARVLGVAGS